MKNMILKIGMYAILGAIAAWLFGFVVLGDVSWILIVLGYYIGAFSPIVFIFFDRKYNRTEKTSKQILKYVEETD